MGTGASNRIQKLPQEVTVGDIVWDGLNSLEVTEVSHTDGSTAIVFATGESWKVDHRGNVMVAVVPTEETDGNSQDSLRSEDIFDL